MVTPHIILTERHRMKQKLTHSLSDKLWKWKWRKQTGKKHRRKQERQKSYRHHIYRGWCLSEHPQNLNVVDAKHAHQCVQRFKMKWVRGKLNHFSFASLSLYIVFSLLLVVLWFASVQFGSVGFHSVPFHSIPFCSLFQWPNDISVDQTKWERFCSSILFLFARLHFHQND